MMSYSDSTPAPAIHVSADEAAIAILEPLVHAEAFFGARPVREVLAEAIDGLAWVSGWTGHRLDTAQGVLALLSFYSPCSARPRTLRLIRGGRS